jgi:NDP-sugar pyrophosphorylase family protein
LLAAGRGERLRPLTDVLAKPALPVLDLPLGAWGLSALERSFPPVVVNVSHLAETVVSALGLDRPGGTVRAMLEAPEPLGTGGTLRALRDEVADRLVVWNADSLCDVDLGEVLRAHEVSGAAATIAVTSVSKEADFEVAGTRVTKLIDRREVSAPGARFIGVAVYERSALSLLSDAVPLGATEGLLMPLLERGELHAYEHQGYSLDVGTPARWSEANQHVLNGKAPPPPVEPPGDIVEVPGGRAYAGPGVGAEVESLGPGAILLAGSAADAGAYITNSVVWPAERVPAGTELMDAIWFGGRPLPLDYGD